MKSKWFKTTIGEQATLQRGFDITSKQHITGTIPIVSSGGISGYHNRAMVSGPGVITGRKGTLGTVFYVENDYWPHDTTLWVKDFHGNHPRFVYYFFKSLDFSTLDVGSSNPTLNRNHVHPIEVWWPPIEEQLEIASILGTLDDKIDLNSRMNATLETTTRAIFQSCFVNFDPVHAKAKGRQPEGVDDETAALFPDSFEESVAGLIPIGWRVEPLDRIADYQNGLALQKFPPEGNDFLPVIKIRELRQGFVDDNSDKASPNIRESCIVYDGDVLFSWSGSLMVDLWCGGTGALNQHLFKVTSKTYPKWFFLYWTRHHLDDFVRVAADKATTMGHIQRHHLSSAYTVVPPDEVLARLDQTMGPLVDKMIQSRLESRKLAETRDTLLPLLMAGKLL
jgi:type I restriction enzyme S subunit